MMFPLTLILSFGLISWCDGLSCIECTDAIRAECTPLRKIDCPYGIGKDVCGCCPSCLKGPGEKCGGLFNLSGNCGAGFVCVGSDGNLFDGVCIPDSVDCRITVRCDPVQCKEPTNCKFGIGLNRCSCCRECLGGPGDECSLTTPFSAPCGPGMECLGEDEENLGTCEIIGPGYCFKKPSCTKPCCKQPLFCKNGIGRSACRLCDKCLAGVGEPCGYKHTSAVPCALGLWCSGERSLGGKYQRGICIQAPSETTTINI